MHVDYSLYLVTDSTREILGGKDLVEVVTQAIEGGVTIVQYRDKKSSSRTLQETASLLHEVTQNFGIPLIINDRVDVALAVGAEGVHLGQDDMDIASARAILGSNAIIGVTCATAREAELAVFGGADYLGIGTVFATSTKADTKHIIGPSGVRAVLERVSTLADSPKWTATIAIGGIKASNIQRVVFQSKSAFRALDGVAVVSAIIAAEAPSSAAGELRVLLQTPPAFCVPSPIKDYSSDPISLISKVPSIAKRVAETGPLSHNMTNQVVANLAANVALAVGARPIMSLDGGEAQDLSHMGGCLVINIGTVQPHVMNNYLQAITAYNAAGGPVLFDPVGAGATEMRREAVKPLMDGGYFDVIKGNETEISVLCGALKYQQRGVDSGKSESTHQEKAALVKKLAKREKNVVIMTGEIDYISDGISTYAVGNGHPYMSRVTGTGCTLGTTIASFTAVEKQDKLLAALAALLVFEIAAELACEKPSVQGPGTFVPAFIDCLYDISERCERKENGWLSKAKVELVAI